MPFSLSHKEKKKPLIPHGGSEGLSDEEGGGGLRKLNSLLEL